VEEVLVDHQKHAMNIKTVEHQSYTEQDRKQDMLVLYTQTTVKLLRLYGPAVIIGSVSIGCLTKSHNIMVQRNAALSAAYAGLDASFKNYRERVQNELGEDKEREIYRDAQHSVEKIDGKKFKTVYGGGGGSDYVELWSADTTHQFHVGSHEANVMKLRQRENYLNDKLRMRGHLFLNEALEELGLEHSTAGSVVGWLWKPEDPNHNGQSFVSFCCWTDEQRDQIDPLCMNNEGGIFLDFNVDGEIWKRLDEVKPIWKLTDKALRRQRRG
jgi:hypothetical protein